MATKTYTEYLEEILKSQKQLEKDKLNAIETEYGALKKQVKGQYVNDISAVQESYDEYIDRSYVQKLIDKKQVEETMANMGLTDSGLNRTQQTAVELSHSNRTANYNALKQQKIDSLAQAMREKITDLDIKKTESQQSVKDQLYSNAETKATKLYSDQQTQENKTKTQTTKQEKEWQNLVDAVFDDEMSFMQKNFLVEQYYLKFGFTENEKTLLKKANIYHNSFDSSTGTSTSNDTKINYNNISDDRKAELKQMCNKFISIEEFAAELKLGAYKGSYDDYRRETMQKWLKNKKITEMEYQYLLQELNIKG